MSRQIQNIVNIGPSVGVELGFGLGSSGAVNFTFGAIAQVRVFLVQSTFLLMMRITQVPPGAFVSLDLVNATGQWAPAFHSGGW